MQITRGKQPGALKVVLYGAEGVGKSTFASRFPEPVYIDTEGSTKHLDVARFPKPASWTELLGTIGEVAQKPSLCKTLVIDTTDWAELLCVRHVCTAHKKKSIEDFGYGKGYVFVGEEFSRLLETLDQVVAQGVHVVLLAHAKLRKFEQPDELGAYDRWEMKLSKHTAPLLKEWADMVLFANFKTYVVKRDDGKSKAQGGSVRVMYTSHHACWDAKNRQGLPDELPLDFGEIAHLFGNNAPALVPPVPSSAETKQEVEQPSGANPELQFSLTGYPEIKNNDPAPELITPPDLPDGSDGSNSVDYTGIPPELVKLMIANKVEPVDLQLVVADKGYYPVDIPIANYDPAFVQGVLIGAWEQVLQMVEQSRGFPGDKMSK